MNYYDILFAKKMGGEVAPPEDSYQLKSITTPTSLATFEASEMPMPSLKVSVEAKQDLHGYDHPWVGGAGKNKLPNALNNNQSSITQFDVVMTIDGDGFHFQGTSSGNGGRLNLITKSINLSAGTYTFSASNLGTNLTAYVEVRSDIIANANNPVFTLTETTTVYVGFNVVNGATYNLTAFVQIEQGSTSTSFEPYSNICPITGWDAVVVSDVDDVDNPTVTQTTTITLPQTVYGAEVDVVNGGGKSNLAYIELLSTGWAQETDKPNVFTNYAIKAPTAYPQLICSHAIRAGSYNSIINTDNTIALSTSRVLWHESSFNTAEELEQYLANNTVQIAYELATPTTFTTQPTPIKSLNGHNNLSVDCGEVIEGEYFKAL